MKKLLLLLPLLFVVSCGESFEDEYLLCSQTASGIDATDTGGGKIYETSTDESASRFKHTQDALIDLAATPPQAYPFIKKDEQGYRYFEINLLERGGIVDTPVTYKYHPIFKDMETSVLALTLWYQCTKAG
jgi:hypothetical protein